MKRTFKQLAGLCLCLLSLQASAQTETFKVWMDEGTLTADGTTKTTLTFYQNDPSASYTGFNMSIIVPQGVSVAKVKEGREWVDDIHLTERATTSHSIDCLMPTPKVINIISSSSLNQDFYPDDEAGNPLDAIFTIGLVADPLMVNGEYEVRIVNCKFANINDWASTPLTPLTTKLTVTQGRDPATMPATGEFYRLKGEMSGLYVEADDDATVLKMSEDDGYNSDRLLFYYADDNRHLINRYNGCSIFQGMKPGKPGEADVWNVLPTQQDGIFRLDGGNGVETNWMLDMADNTVDGTPSPCVGASEDFNEERGLWRMERCEEFLINITPAGFATLYSPLPLYVGGEIRAYTAVVENGKLLLHPVTEIIPANTAVIVEGNHGIHRLGICRDAEAAATAKAQIAANDLTGDIRAHYAPEGTVLTLQQIAGRVGLYRFNKHTFIPGFRAYMPYAGQQAVEGFAFELNTTGGLAPLAEPAGEDRTYDLGGRRTDTKEQGVYIINGEKKIKP